MSDQISEFLQARIDAGDFPSAVYLIAEKGNIVFQEAVGYAVVEPERLEARVDTIYDVASLTKVLVTGLLAAKLIEQGEIQLDSLVRNYLQDFNTEGKQNLTVRDLLVHTSRMYAWKPLYLCVSDPSKVIGEIAETPLNFEQEAVTYSDLNFIALGELLEHVTDKKLDTLAREDIFDPLGLRNTVFNPAGTVKRIVAASEKGNAFERQTCIEQGYLDGGDENPVAIADGSNAFRNEVIWGEVHDGNAYFMGGVAGHAGLFSTAEETFKIAQQFLPNYTTLLKSETCELFRANFTNGMNEDRSLSFQLASTKDSTAGIQMSPESFGHLGFTGTSLWIDPVKERIFILLTNRTHCHSLPFVNINSVRREFHNIVIGLLDKNL